MTCTLSVCLITKNEERNLKKCINSIKAVSDEIVIVDTGSNDNTVKLAKSLGANVFCYNWENDFSKARNYALGKCTKDWILVMDADEALENGHDKIIKKAINYSSKQGLYMQLNNLIGSTIINQNPTLRLFRNNKSYRYENKIHEQIVNSITTVSGSNSFETINAIINHYGYDHNIVDMNLKSIRNINILNSYSETEKDSIYYFGLGNEYMKTNRMADAKNLMLLALNYKDKDQGTHTYAAASLIQCCMQLNEFSSAIKYLSEFLTVYPDFKDLYFLKSACCNSLMKYSDSYIALSIFNSLPSVPSKYPCFDFDVSNNIPELLSSLEQLKVPTANNFISIIIEVTNPNSNYKNVILSCNEISENVLVLDQSTSKEIRYIATECGASYFSATNSNIENIKKSIKSKWILNLNENIPLEPNDRCEIIKNLSTEIIPTKYTIQKNF